MDLRKGLFLVAGAGIGAGLMYLFDPTMGKRRMSLVRDQFVSINKRTGRLVRGRAEDMKHRLYGMYCETRAALGRPCSHSGHKSFRRARESA